MLHKNVFFTLSLCGTTFTGFPHRLELSGNFGSQGKCQGISVYLSNNVTLGCLFTLSLCEINFTGFPLRLEQSENFGSQGKSQGISVYLSNNVTLECLFTLSLCETTVTEGEEAESGNFVRPEQWEPCISFQRKGSNILVIFCTFF